MKIWTENKIRDVIKEALEENYFFKLEDAGDEAFILTNECKEEQSFIINIAEVERQKAFKVKDLPQLLSFIDYTSKSYVPGIDPVSGEPVVTMPVTVLRDFKYHLEDKTNKEIESFKAKIRGVLL